MTENAVLKAALSSLKKLQTSTGDVYSKESALDALINIQYLKKSIEEVDSALRESIKNQGLDLPYENEIGKIDMKAQSETVQDTNAIITAIGIKKLIEANAVKITKSKLSDHDQKVVALHETKTEKDPVLNIALRKKPEKVGVFTLA